MQRGFGVASVLVGGLLVNALAWRVLPGESQGNFNWARVLLAALTAPVWYRIGVLIGQRLESGPVRAGIGGWLILPAIYLVATAIIQTLAFILGSISVPAIVTSGSAGSAVAQIALSGAFAVYCLSAAFFFFARRRLARSLMIGFGALTLLLGTLTHLLDVRDGKEFSAERLLGPSVFAAIWISYFWFSRRVKATFQTESVISRAG